MPLLPSYFFRFFAFVGRFKPFWLVWALVVLFPAPREAWRLHFAGSPLINAYDQPWRQSFGRAARFNGFRLAQKKPRDLGAQAWRFSLLRRGVSEDFEGEGYFDPTITLWNRYYYSGYDSDNNSQSATTLLREARDMQNAFPQQPWLRGLAVSVIASRMEDLCDVRPKNAPPRRGFGAAPQAGTLSLKRARELALIPQRAARFEPNNAFYALVEAEIWRRSHNSAAMWRALKRAARGKVFDTHDLEFARAVVAAYEAVQPLLLEEKNAVWRANNGSDSRSFDQWTQFVPHEGRVARKAGDHRRVIEIAATFASIGDLMQRGNNTRASAYTGGRWKLSAWNLTPRRRMKPRAGKAWWQRRTEHFASYATLHGRKDVAARVPAWAARDRELNYLNEETSYNLDYGVYYGSYEMMRPSKRDALARAGKWRDVGAMVMAHGAFVAAVWFLAMLFLWRGIGPASTRRERIGPAVWAVLVALGLALWTWRQAEIFDSPAWQAAASRRNNGLEIAAAMVGMLAFFGPPFLLALGCAAATMAVHRAEFLKSARIDTELQLAPRDALLLKSGAAILGALALASAWLLWLVWLLLIAFDVPTLDLLAWMPDDRSGRSWSWPQKTEDMLGFPLLYCLFLSFLGWLGWFCKWRYFSGKDARALTQGGLRRWKESLGMYLVLASALYLGLALAAWPARAAASRELETRMARGELAG